MDLSPAATFIAYNYNTPVDVAAFEAEAKRILAVETAVPRIVRSMADWGVLAAAGEKGAYQAALLLAPTDPQTISWLLKSVGRLRDTEAPAGDLLHGAELFPFRF
ncbi:MAG: hypothetical protein WHX53_08565 [Anaerolineae bacterium]